jgi:hypothetical protein
MRHPHWPWPVRLRLGHLLPNSFPASSTQEHLRYTDPAATTPPPVTRFVEVMTVMLALRVPLGEARDPDRVVRDGPQSAAQAVGAAITPAFSDRQAW